MARYWWLYHRVIVGHCLWLALSLWSELSVYHPPCWSSGSTQHGEGRSQDRLDTGEGRLRGAVRVRVGAASCRSAWRLAKVACGVQLGGHWACGPGLVVINPGRGVRRPRDSWS